MDTRMAVHMDSSTVLFSCIGWHCIHQGGVVTASRQGVWPWSMVISAETWSE